MYSDWPLDWVYHNPRANVIAELVVVVVVVVGALSKEEARHSQTME